MQNRNLQRLLTSEIVVTVPRVTQQHLSVPVVRIGLQVTKVPMFEYKRVGEEVHIEHVGDVSAQFDRLF